MPQFLLEHNEGGVSNYGTYARTIVPFTLAFMLSAGFALWSACLIPATSKTRRHFRLILQLYALIFLVVMGSTYPYKVNSFFDNLHIAAAILVTCFELATGVWLVRQGGKMADRIWLTVLMVGFIAAVLTLGGVGHILLMTQGVVSLAFGVLLVRGGKRLVQ